MFEVTNLRTGETLALTSSQFKEKIILETRCTFEDSYVLRERTGLRPQHIHRLIRDLAPHYYILSNVFIVTALSRINNDYNTRYMILIDGGEINIEILDVLRDYVPIYHVDIQNQMRVIGHNSELSTWFRNTMGRGFSFIDIDYLIFNPDSNSLVMIEEKVDTTSVSSIGYGQRLSYMELLSDIFNRNSTLIFVFSTTSTVVSTKVSYYICNQDSFRSRNFVNFSTREGELSTLYTIIREIIED
jgi:hypothetical protein